MVGAVALGHHRGEFGFVELRVVEGDRAGVHRRIAQAGHQRHHGARIDAAREEGAKRHFADQAHLDRLAQAADEFLGRVGERNFVVERVAHVPEHLGLRHGFAALDQHALARAELARALEDCARLGDVAEGEVFLDRARIEAAIQLRVRHQHLQFGTEQQRAVVEQAVEQRLDAHAVARHEQRALRAVVHGKRKHAAKAMHAVLAPGPPGVHDHLGIAAGAEAVAQRFEFRHQLLEVVDLAVEHHRDAAVLVEHRLLAAGDVDDRQTPVAQRQPRLEVVAALIRAAMVLGVVHAPHQRLVKVARTARVEHSGNAAHVAVPCCYRPPGGTPAAASACSYTPA